MRAVEVIILSIPFNSIPKIAPLIAAVPEETVVIDTSNYYPHRDTKIAAIEAGQVESLWVVEQLGRPIAKALECYRLGLVRNQGQAQVSRGAHRDPCGSRPRP